MAALARPVVVVHGHGLVVEAKSSGSSVQGVRRRTTGRRSARHGVADADSISAISRSICKSFPCLAKHRRPVVGREGPRETRGGEDRTFRVLHVHQGAFGGKRGQRVPPQRGGNLKEKPVRTVCKASLSDGRTASGSESSGTGRVALPDESEVRASLGEISDSLRSISTDFMRKLPSDLQVDIKDAAFILSSGQVALECGEQSGAALTQLANALEAGDRTSAAAAASLLPEAVATLDPGSAERNALGKRLKAAGRRFTGTGSYGDGELLKIGRALISAGEIVAQGCKEAGPRTPSIASRTLKFGSLEVAITRERAFTGAAVSVGFGLISLWLTRGLQGTNQDLDYANQNAVSVALSLRGTLLAMGYYSSALAALVAVGLVALGIQVNGGDSDNDSSKT
ncbi:hypothetical protein CBR_g11120 [Chara braunii]|uniref:Uncharacterized protein n=1 Tax=Chara braunii TaxID=69332 RepID=A0A388KQ80_CHABU|nr:hypothetical protein CBR_g11120 [Chara braunii]|eukprot:GBG72187.1 hypothetical protein CBR_g11120 [Chara braunii]